MRFHCGLIATKGFNERRCDLDQFAEQSWEFGLVGAIKANENNRAD